MIKKNKIKILIADEINPDGLKLLPDKFFHVSINTKLSNSEILKSYNDYDVLIIRSVRKICKSFLDKCGFKIIATCSKGLDHIDVEYAKKRKILIINSESGNTVSAAEHTFALILEIFKKINYSDSLVRKNKFSDYNFPRYELRGKKIGIIGFGKVGSRVARYASAFEMIIYANDINATVRKNNKKYKFKSLKYILENSDIISIHIPLNKKNVNFINKDRLKLISDKSVLINTSRGEILDEKYLIYLLNKEKIYFAGLDVFKNEPEINNAFFRLKNVLLTNHTAGKTYESYKYISKEIFMQVKNYFLYKQNFNEKNFFT